jgi:hypothetical protein
MAETAINLVFVHNKAFLFLNIALVRIQCGMTWYGVVWRGVAWCGVVWHGMPWYAVVCRSMAWMAWYGVV